jgi:hypothetical protein
VSGGQGHSKDSWYVTTGSQGNRQSDSPTEKDSLLFFLGDDEEMRLLLMTMMRGELQ